MRKSRRHKRVERERAVPSQVQAKPPIGYAQFSYKPFLPYALSFLFFPLCTLGGYISVNWKGQTIPEFPPPAPISRPEDFYPDLEHLIMLNPGQLEGTDIALMNLACAKGLPGNENLDPAQCLETLNNWAERVRTETDRNIHQFREHPENFHNSEAYFRALCLVTVLQQDFKVHYNLDRMADKGFSHAEDVFIPGLLNNLREGTCSSMPVLYTAIARRLGYPVFLVAVRAHLFCRWQSPDGKVRFNMEATNRGLTCDSDEFYKTWPYTMTAGEMLEGVYLRNLTDGEALAIFLELRGNVFDSLQRMPEAELAYAEAHALYPNNEQLFGWLAIARGKEDMMSKGMLDPKDPKNPYRNKEPAPYNFLPDDIPGGDVVFDSSGK
jgi:hypothetical protein